MRLGSRASQPPGACGAAPRPPVGSFPVGERENGAGPPLTARGSGVATRPGQLLSRKGRLSVNGTSLRIFCRSSSRTRAAGLGSTASARQSTQVWLPQGGRVVTLWPPPAPAARPAAPSRFCTSPGGRGALTLGLTSPRPLPAGPRSRLAPPVPVKGQGAAQEAGHHGLAVLGRQEGHAVLCGLPDMLLPRLLQLGAQHTHDLRDLRGPHGQARGTRSGPGHTAGCGGDTHRSGGTTGVCVRPEVSRPHGPLRPCRHRGCPLLPQLPAWPRGSCPVACCRHAQRTSVGVRNTAALGDGGLVCLNLGVRAGRGQLGIRVTALGPRRGAGLY